VSNPNPTFDRALTSFNARTYSAQRVAKSFVPPEAFFTLINPVHSVLSGPRGSGKTTLLKMLQPEALEHWQHEAAAPTLASIEYTGVFIATDRLWKQQLEPVQPSAGAEWRDALATSAFATHVMRELVATMAWRAHDAPERYPHHARAELSPADELLLVRELANLLHLVVEVPRLESVVSALILRFRQHGELQRIPDPRVGDVPPWLIRDTLGTAEACVRLFNNACRQNDHQWALLFDEMELAPAAVTSSVLDAMRGAQSVLLLKLSISPAQPELARLNLPLAGVHGQDYELIRLSSQYAAAPQFAEDLIDAELATRFGPDAGLDPVKVFGRGRFVSEGGRQDPYRVGGQLHARFKSLAASDPSFQEWLHRRGVDLDALDGLTPNQRAARVRKVRNLVLIREFYRRPAQTGRKSHELYTGAEGLTTLVDANPRLLMALLGRVLPSQLPERLPIDRSAQSAAIDSVIDRFLTLLRSQPAIELPDGRLLRPADLFESIGQEFGRRIVSETFNDNVVTLFQVDRRTPTHITRALQVALNVGAVVHVPKDDGRPARSDLEGELFRLSYLLAPRYRLPLRLGESRGLRSILSNTEARRWYPAAEISTRKREVLDPLFEMRSDGESEGAK
jgi:hypothetical protein